MADELTSSTCPIQTCGVSIPRSMLMCRNHWYRVPYPLRREVFRTYRRGQELTGNPSSEYVEAMTAAIQAVNEKINSPK